ncbi:MAG: ferritin-like domain-containing protein [Candidatus Omnitrophica bacterium]|nr:ferritin-like domain-containing protein [Candidatus Omnitrophota bacterium]
MSKKLTSLQELYVHELKDIYSAEKQIARALPKLAKAVNSDELKTAIQEHLEQTEGQISRLEKIFKILGESSSGPKCKGMEGLLAEGEDFTKEEAAEAVLDAGIIVGAQKVEHYEIAAYGSLCTFAEILGYDEDLQLLKETLAEEEETDQRLTQIAQGLNHEADSGNDSDDQEMEMASKSKKSSSRRF